jgi:hypothetical protein
MNARDVSVSQVLMSRSGHYRNCLESREDRTPDAATLMQRIAQHDAL